MSEITKCQSCKGDFDSQDKIPMLLPCEHNVCYKCANDQYKQNKLIKCDLQSCYKVHKIRPYYLKEDKQQLKRLEQKRLQETISMPESHKANLYTAQKQLSGQQTNIIQKQMKNQNDYVQKENIEQQKEFKKVNKNIKTKKTEQSQQIQEFNKI